MSYDNHFGGVIWTNHALERLGHRGLTQKIAWEAYRYPETKEKNDQGGWEYKRRVGNSTVTVIAKQNERGEWLIISNWVNPPIAGSEEHQEHQQYKQYKKASEWKKVLLTIKQQLGF